MNTYNRAGKTVVKSDKHGRPFKPDACPSTSRWRARMLYGPAYKYKCADCKKPALEYDHPFGYGTNWNLVDPICRSCHRKREWARGRKSLKRYWPNRKDYMSWYYKTHKEKWINFK